MILLIQRREERELWVGESVADLWLWVVVNSGSGKWKVEVKGVQVDIVFGTFRQHDNSSRYFAYLLVPTYTITKKVMAHS